MLDPLLGILLVCGITLQYECQYHDLMRYTEGWHYSASVHENHRTRRILMAWPKCPPEISQIWIEYIKPIGQMPGEPWNFSVTLQCHANINLSIYFKIHTKDTPLLVHKGEVWDVFCELKLWLKFCLSHFSDVCNIMLNVCNIMLNWTVFKLLWSSETI